MQLFSYILSQSVHCWYVEWSLIFLVLLIRQYAGCYFSTFAIKILMTFVGSQKVY
jgi:hypothetical protein